MISRSAARACSRAFSGVGSKKGVELRVERLDARQQRVGQLDRREPALLDQARRFGDRQPMKFGLR